MNAAICQRQYYIISDNKMNRKISKYSCPALTNLNYKVNQKNRLMIFYSKDAAVNHLQFCGDDTIKSYFDVREVDMNDIQKLTACFNLLCDYY